MKLKDLEPHQVAVVTRTARGAAKVGGVGSIVVGLRNQTRFIGFSVDNASYFGPNDAEDSEGRLLEEGDELKWIGVLVMKNEPSPAKVESVHPSELKVGQLGRIACQGDARPDDWKIGAVILRTNRNAYTRGYGFLNQETGCVADSFPASFRVHPYPIGSKIVPQSDGSIVVEEPEVKPMGIGSLSQGEYFADERGDIGIRTNIGATWLVAPKGDIGYSQKLEMTSRVCIRKVTPAEAAAIIAKAGE